MYNKIEHIIRKILHILELTIAVVSILVLAGILINEIINIFTHPEHYADATHFLHSILTIVVGLEFVRMLIDMTPANTIEVLIMATARHIIMDASSPVNTLVGILCIAALFATRRFLIPRNEMKEELVEVE